MHPVEIILETKLGHVTPLLHPSVALHSLWMHSSGLRVSPPSTFQPQELSPQLTPSPCPRQEADPRPGQARSLPAPRYVGVLGTCRPRSVECWGPALLQSPRGHALCNLGHRWVVGQSST